MAKGGGGEGHYDERRRAAKPKVVSGYADSPEVLAAVVKPRAKPDVVIKKKPILTPAKKPTKTVPGLRMGAAQAEVRVGNLPRKFDLGPFDDQIVTSASKEDRDTGGVSPASAITAPRKYPSPTSAAKGNRGGGYTPQRDKDNAFPNFSNQNPGGGLYGKGKSLLDWVKRRGSRRMLDM